MSAGVKVEARGASVSLALRDASGTLVEGILTPEVARGLAVLLVECAEAAAEVEACRVVAAGRLQ